MPADHIAWEQVCELVSTALELAPGERDAFLNGAAVDAAVRAEAVSLVTASEKSTAALFDRGLEIVTPAIREVPMPSFWMGQRLGAYQVVGEVGEGGMGLVLVGERADGLYERKVAIKVIRSALATEDLVRRFQRETRILAKLQHPAITTLLDAGITGEQLPFLVMEFVDGLPIDQYAEREGLQLDGVLKLAVSLCEALVHAHAQGIVHQDVKPSNILVNRQGQLKLLDFGIAHLAHPGAEHGERTFLNFRAVTPAYASPEQFSGGEVDARTDIYSLGVVLFLLVTGELPFNLEGLSPVEIERILQTGDPTLPSRKAAVRFAREEVAVLDAVIEKAMHPDPAQRYGSAEELKEELLRIIAREEPRASARRHFAGRWWQRRRATVKWTALAGFAISAAGVAGLWQHVHRPARQAEGRGRISIAVVPVPNSSGQPWIATAVGEALATELSGGGQIRVIPPLEVAQAIRDLHSTPASVLTDPARTRLADRLGVEYLVEERSDLDSGGNTLHLEGALYRSKTKQAISTQRADGEIHDLEGATQHLAVSLARVLPLRRGLAAPPPPSLLPRSTAAVRAYTEGLGHLEALEPTAARDFFQQAAEAEPSSPVVHAALARTWSMLGYQQKAMAEAETAISLDSGLPLRTRLMLEAQANEIRRQWPAAIAAYSKLRDFDPDEVEHVMGLARCQLAAGNGEQAFATLRNAEQMPGLLGADPRIELLAATVEQELSRHAAALRDADDVLAAARERGATQLMAQAQAARASALETLGKLDEGLQAAQEAQRLFAQAGDIEGEGVSLIATGRVLEDHGQHEEAKQRYLKAEEIFVRTGDQSNAAVAENALGLVYDGEGDWQESLLHYTNALETFRRIDDKQRIPPALNAVGTIEGRLDHPDAEKRCYLEALQLLKQLHDDKRVAQEYNNLGILAIKEGDLDGAEREFKQALDISSQTGRMTGKIHAMFGLGHVAWNRGKLDEAHARYLEIIGIERRSSEMKQLAFALRVDAHVLHDRGDEQLAMKELAESQALRAAQKEVIAAAETQLSKITFDSDDGQTPTTDAQFEQLLTVFQTKKDDVDAADTELAWATSLLLQGRDADAAKHFQSARLLIRPLHDPDLSCTCDIVKAKIASKRGDAVTAEALLRKCLERARRHHDTPMEMNLHLLLAETKAAAGKASTALVVQYAQEARSHGFLRVASRLESLQKARSR